MDLEVAMAIKDAQVKSCLVRGESGGGLSAVV
jgi:hypothetical protein